VSLVLAAALVASFVLVSTAGCSREPARPVRVESATPFVWRLPAGFPVPQVPPDNPMTTEKVDLGRRLFYDTRLSANRTFACASCHQQARAFTDGRAQAIGSTGALHVRSSMSLANVAYNTSLGWAEPTRALEQQMLVPMFNQHPIELGLKGHEDEVVARFAGDVDRFRDAFPGEASPLTLPNIVKAIAAFERTLLSGDSPFDRYLYRDDRSGMSPAALRGMKLFFSDRLRCGECHGSFNLSGPVTFAGRTAADEKGDLLFHNTGLHDVDGDGAYPASDRGLFDRTKRPADMGRFRAPTLRNIAVTGPYMHDGTVPSLEAVIAHYASGGKRSRFRSDRVRGFVLTLAGKADLLAFLHSLTDEGFLTDPAFAPPVAGPAPAKTADARLKGHGGEPSR
jgi:cytochrome c peroxidase